MMFKERRTVERTPRLESFAALSQALRHHLRRHDAGRRHGSPFEEQALGGLLFELEGHIRQAAHQMALPGNGLADAVAATARFVDAVALAMELDRRGLLQRFSPSRHRIEAFLASALLERLKEWRMPDLFRAIEVMVRAREEDLQHALDLLGLLSPPLPTLNVSTTLEQWLALVDDALAQTVMHLHDHLVPGTALERRTTFPPRHFKPVDYPDRQEPVDPPRPDRNPGLVGPGRIGACLSEKGRAMKTLPPLRFLKIPILVYLVVGCLAVPLRANEVRSVLQYYLTVRTDLSRVITEWNQGTREWDFISRQAITVSINQTLRGILKVTSQLMARPVQSLEEATEATALFVEAFALAIRLNKMGILAHFSVRENNLAGFVADTLLDEKKRKIPEMLQALRIISEAHESAVCKLLYALRTRLNPSTQLAISNPTTHPPGQFAFLLPHITPMQWMEEVKETWFAVLTCLQSSVPADNPLRKNLDRLLALSRRHFARYRGNYELRITLQGWKTWIRESRGLMAALAGKPARFVRTAQTIVRFFKGLAPR